MKVRKCLKCHKELPIHNFYQKKTGEYDFLCKEHRKEEIFDDQLWTVLDACKYFDIPFIEDKWFHLVFSTICSCISHKRQYNTVFGKYLSKMYSKDYRNYTYEDSFYSKDLINEKKYNI